LNKRTKTNIFNDEVAGEYVLTLLILLNISEIIERLNATSLSNPTTETLLFIPRPPKCYLMRGTISLSSSRGIEKKDLPKEETLLIERLRTPVSLCVAILYCVRLP
jgi:hypothetical protein